MSEPLCRTLPLSVPLNLRLTCVLHRRGPRDPTMRVDARRMLRASRTPEGPSTLHVVLHPGEVVAEAWGPGAEWELDRLPALLGLDDRPEDLVARDDVVRRLQARAAGVRIGSTGRVMEALIPAILEQKVTSHEAHRAYRHMAYALGEPAPGPFPLRLPAAPELLARLPYERFHRFGVERRRADFIRLACSRAPSLERAANDPVEVASRKLRSLLGIGVWTFAEVAVRSFGDTDAVSVGDYHLPHLVTYVFTGRPRGSDEIMLELLAPYTGQRARVVKLIEYGAARPPRVAPRMRLRDLQSM